MLHLGLGQLHFLKPIPIIFLPILSSQFTVIISVEIRLAGQAENCKSIASVL